MSKKQNRSFSSQEYVLGIDLGGTNIECGLVDKKGAVRSRSSGATENKKGRRVILNNIVRIAGEVINEAKRKNLDVVAVSIGTPGALDKKTGIVVGGAPNIPGWKGTPLLKTLRKEFKLPAFGSNDVTLYTLGEAVFGAGKGYQEIVCLALGTGIGGGIVTGGRIYRGALDGAAEVGHMTVKVDGRKCKCGSFGCLERYASATAVADMGKELCRRNKNSLILKLADMDEKRIDAKIVFEAAKRGDMGAKQVVQTVGWYLGAGIANLINIMNPEAVIIGGGVARSGRILLRAIKKAISTYGLKVNTQNVKVLIGSLKEDAGIIGAAALAWQELEAR